jgi:carbamoylphosphate synthase large subunit
MNNPLTFLCIASYYKGNRFLQGLKQCGARVYLLTSKRHEDKAWPHESLDNIFYIESDERNHWNMQDVVKGLAWLMRKEKIDRIVSLDDFDVEKGALLREEFRIAGMGQTTARYFRDKLAMRLKARASGVRVPEFTAVFNDEMVAEFIRTVPTPWMLKPRGEASATGIKKIFNPEELWNKLHDLGEERHLYLLERFIPGQVYHMDSIVQDGIVDFVRCSQYMAPPFEVAHGGGIFRSVTMDQSSEDNVTLEKLNRQIISAFNLQYSATHTEALKSEEDGKFYFIETSARVGGAHIAELVEFATGLNLWEEWAKVEYANAANQKYTSPSGSLLQAGIIISLVKNEKPDYSKFTDPEIVWTMNDLDHHVGIIAKADNRARVIQLMDEYAHIIKNEYHAAAPAPDKPIH